MTPDSVETRYTTPITKLFFGENIMGKADWISGHEDGKRIGTATCVVKSKTGVLRPESGEDAVIEIKIVLDEGSKGINSLLSINYLEIIMTAMPGDDMSKKFSGFADVEVGLCQGKYSNSEVG